MTNDYRTPEEIERDIERERAELTHTLDDLQDRFSVEGIARQLTDQFRENGGEIGRSVSDAVKRNPLGLALTGVGLAWLMFGRNETGSRDSYGRVVDRSSADRYPGDRYHDNRLRDRGLGTDRDMHEERYATAAPATRATPATGTRSYYAGRSQPSELPSWARGYYDESDRGDDEGMSDRAKRMAHDASDRVAGAGSATADAARNAGSSVASGAKSAGSAVSDTARSAGSSVAQGAKSAGSAVRQGAQTARDTASQTASSVASGVRGAANATGERAAAMRARLAEGTEHLSEEARNRVVAARERAIAARDSAYEYGRYGRERAGDLFEQHPFVAGALALAVGAAVGAALPRSRVEDEYAGAHSDRLFDEAERIFNEEKEKLGAVAKAATDEAKTVAKEMKQDADDKAPADTAADAAKEKAKSSAQRVADAAQSEAKKQNLGDVKS